MSVQKVPVTVDPDFLALVVARVQLALAETDAVPGKSGDGNTKTTTASASIHSSPRAKQASSKKSPQQRKVDPRVRSVSAEELAQNEHVARVVRDFVKKLLGRRSATSSFPPPPTPGELAALSSRNPTFSKPRDSSTLLALDEVSFVNGGFSDAFFDSARLHLSRWGLTRITFDFLNDPELEGQYNLFVCDVILELFRYASLSREIALAIDDLPDTPVLVAILRRYWTTLMRQARTDARDPKSLARQRANRTANSAQQRLLREYREYLIDARVRHDIIELFNGSALLMPVELASDQQPVHHEKIVEFPAWWSEGLSNLMQAIEVRVHNRYLLKRGNKPQRGAPRFKRIFRLDTETSLGGIPPGVPEDLIAIAVLETFDLRTRRELKLGAPLNMPTPVDLVFPFRANDCFPPWVPQQPEKRRERVGTVGRDSSEGEGREVSASDDSSQDR